MLLFSAVLVLGCLAALATEGVAGIRERWPYVLAPAAVTALAYPIVRHGRRGDVMDRGFHRSEGLFWGLLAFCLVGVIASAVVVPSVLSIGTWVVLSVSAAANIWVARREKRSL